MNPILRATWLSTFIVVLMVRISEEAVRAEVPWPAEPLAQATNLTSIEGPGENDFYFDLSGAVWNPVTRRLWVVRNGPGGSNSKFWAIRENGLAEYTCTCPFAGASKRKFVKSLLRQVQENCPKMDIKTNIFKSITRIRKDYIGLKYE